MPEPESEAPSALPSSTSLSTASPASRSPSPPLSPHRHSSLSALRRRRVSASLPDKSIMFGNRSNKYAPLPGSTDGRRKRAGAGLTAWKRYLIIGGMACLLLVVAYSTLGGHNGLSRTDSVNTPTYGSGDTSSSSTPNHNEEDDTDLSILPIDKGNPKESVDTYKEEPLDTGKTPVGEDTDEEVKKPTEEVDDEDDTRPSDKTTQGTHPKKFEEDPNAESTTYCAKPFDSTKPLVQYALTIDAGSTGSRIHVYKFHNCQQSPKLEYETFKMLNPGLSSFSGKPEEAAQSLDPLMEEALRVVPQSLWNCSPVEVKATAGLRLLDERAPGESTRILEAVKKHLQTKYKFDVKDVAIMDGKDEGVYAWITANYLLDRIGEGVDSDETLAVMDLGGGSTQIVFEPKFPATGDTKLAEGDHKFELAFGGKNFILYQHSYLGYGLMSARKSIHNLVAFMWGWNQPQLDWSTVNADVEVSNPCLSRGTTRVVELDQPGRGKANVTMHGGNGGFEACNRIVELVMAKDALCHVEPCSFNGVYQPALIDTFKRGKFFALSYFTDRIKPLLPTTTALTLRDLKDIAEAVCNGPTAWEERWGKHPEAMAELKDRPEYCLDLTFMNGLLGLGYEIHDDRELIVGKKVNGVELGWALGAGLALVEKAELKCVA